MSIRNSEIHEGVMLQEEFVSVPVSVFEELIRAETERDILEAVLSGESKYNADEVLKAIKTAREKHHCGVLRIEIGACPCSCEEPDAGAETGCDSEVDPDDAETCE